MENISELYMVQGACTRNNDVLIAWHSQIYSHIDWIVGNVDDESTWCAEPQSNETLLNSKLARF